MKALISLGIVSFLNVTLVSDKVMAQEAFSKSACPQKLENWTSKMLADLPSYTNRVTQRSIINHSQNLIIRNYVIIASNPEFEPIPLIQKQYQPIFPNTSQQLFFTLLERQYATQRVIELQHHYWAFFDLTEQGWRLIMLFSQLASLDKKGKINPLLLTQESENSAIAQAIQLWLRDCNAGAIKFTIKK